MGRMTRGITMTAPATSRCRCAGSPGGDMVVLNSRSVIAVSDDRRPLADRVDDSVRVVGEPGPVVARREVHGDRGVGPAEA